MQFDPHHGHPGSILSIERKGLESSETSDFASGFFATGSSVAYFEEWWLISVATNLLPSSEQSITKKWVRLRSESTPLRLLS